MAGIAFKLRRYTDEASFFGILKGYTYSAMIVAGPWLISATVLGSLVLFVQDELKLPLALIMYIFCFSQICVGIYQFVVTRFLADELYNRDIELYIPTFMGLLLLTLGPQALLSGYCLFTLNISFLIRLYAFLAYLLIHTIWIVLLFLGILRAYQWIVWSFILGGTVSLVTGIIFGNYFYQAGMLFGFVVGQVVILAILIWILLSEFPWNKLIDFSFLSYFRLYPALAVLGLFYYLSIWADKFIYRATDYGYLIAPKWLYAAPTYEIPAFIAQLTVIPALAMFFLKAETDFYVRFREFFTMISQRHSFSEIKASKNIVLQSVKEGFYFILKFQGIITFISILLASQLFSRWLNETEITILRILLPGTFFQICLFLTVILMLYLELFRQALIACTMFFVGNCLFTVLFLYTFPTAPGLGYTISALGAFLYAALSLTISLRRLPEIVFMKQLKPPMIAHKSSFYHQDGHILYRLKPHKERRVYLRHASDQNDQKTP